MCLYCVRGLNSAGKEIYSHSQCVPRSCRGICYGKLAKNKTPTELPSSCLVDCLSASERTEAGRGSWLIMGTSGSRERRTCYLQKIYLLTGERSKDMWAQASKQVLSVVLLRSLTNMLKSHFQQTMSTFLFISKSSRNFRAGSCVKISQTHTWTCIFERTFMHITHSQPLTLKITLTWPINTILNP